MSKKSIVLLLSVGLAGCQTTPPPRGEIPPVGTYTAHDRGTVIEKPLPNQDDGARAMPNGFDDGPLLTQPLPEQAAFVKSYRAVGSPRVALFVNRTLDGVPYPGDTNEQIDRIDYDAVENVMIGWLAADGKVVMVSPRLGATQGRAMNTEGRQGVLQSAAREGGIDVLVHVQARMTRHYGEQPGVRLVAEAVNTQGGESIARAFIDMPPNMEKPIIGERTRYLARKLMQDMTNFWENAPLSSPQPSRPPAPSPSVPPVAPPITPPSTLPQPQ